MKELSPVDAAFLAAWIDNSGQVSVIRGPHNRTYKPNVMITTTTRLEIAEALHKAAGGVGRIIKRPHKTSGTQYLLTLTVQETRELMPQIQPFLIKKAEQAKCLIEINELRDSLRDTGYIAEDPEVVKTRRAMKYRADRIRELNLKHARGSQSVRATRHSARRSN